MAVLCAPGGGEEGGRGGGGGIVWSVGKGEKMVSVWQPAALPGGNPTPGYLSHFSLPAPRKLVLPQENRDRLQCIRCMLVLDSLC